MTARILAILGQEHLKCLPCERVNLDAERFVEYRDNDERPVDAPFERPPLEQSRKRIGDVDPAIPSILGYFLDGSRRTYRVADIIHDGHYLPLIAGQVGVAVLRRVAAAQGLVPFRKFCQVHYVLAFPDVISMDDLRYFQERIREAVDVPFILLRYEVKPERDPVDLGVAKIMSYMQDLEIQAVLGMADEHLLRNDAILVKDGPLQYRKSFDVVQFRNVVGLSKSFRPTFAVGTRRRRQDVGAITSALSFGERTSVFRPVGDEKTIGMWYLRIRPPEKMQNPLQGIIKMECYAVDPEDREEGLSAERVDIVSQHILRERNVTPYGADVRWASHIYPIYMAETYLKASFMSDTMFKALF